MPWKAASPVDLRMQFVMRLRDGERMTDLCAEFGISRKTGYKLVERYERLGALGLVDQSRAPKSGKHRISDEIAELIIKARTAHPSWGGRKLRDVLMRQHPEILFPAASSIGTLLKRRGLVTTRKRRSTTQRYAYGLQTATAPNDVWCTDYKGQFRLGDGAYCYPLTITDRYSRRIMGCEGYKRIDWETAMLTFEVVFREHGLPKVIRSDNGAPFASSGLRGFTKLNVWWKRLGIHHERTQPSSPQQNGQHERMHRDLKRDTTRPAAKNLLAQQERFDAFVDEYNAQRPHEALDQKRPNEVYVSSTREMPDKLVDPTYPLHDDVVVVSRGGHVRLGREQVFLSAALHTQLVGVRELNNGDLLLSFLDDDLGVWSPQTGLVTAEQTEGFSLVTPPAS